MKKIEDFFHNMVGGIAVVLISMGNTHWLERPTHAIAGMLRAIGSFFSRNWWRLLLGAIALVILWVLFLAGSALVSWAKVGMEQSAATQTVQAAQTAVATQTLAAQVRENAIATQRAIPTATTIPTLTPTPVLPIFGDAVYTVSVPEMVIHDTVKCGQVTFINQGETLQIAGLNGMNFSVTSSDVTQYDKNGDTWIIVVNANRFGVAHDAGGWHVDWMKGCK